MLGNQTANGYLFLILYDTDSPLEGSIVVCFRKRSYLEPPCRTLPENESDFMEEIARVDDKIPF